MKVEVAEFHPHYYGSVATGDNTPYTSMIREGGLILVGHTKYMLERHPIHIWDVGTHIRVVSYD